ncbi:hypothetical protein Bcav_2297 [Beutenbergia cavernae DSM 12333]|uniref:Uncharacterized protein n=1 Tax=Beutenbergia cavernae (strain ATCC BAA-8 / DSM 12333 / CCUG 43141 / JCM 11478 / NBRC 16432 / NCIMB 13614 / HKI 0122) TaxID=471853 RepID=C5BVU7_BEUC1|nr:hypothetical protein Bcav_2297 [Beutenbergia cavernae DSM 12333]
MATSHLHAALQLGRAGSLCPTKARLRPLGFEPVE